MRRRGRGFTLIEVLIAMSILVTVVTVLWRSMALTFETKARVMAINDRYHEARQVMARISRELRMAFLRAIVINPLNPDEQIEAAIKTQMKGAEDEIFFATTAHLALQANSTESDQCEIGYFLKRGNERNPRYKGQTLYRRESKRLDDKPDRGGATWPMIEGVKELKIEYWDDGKAIGDDAWKGEWDTESTDAAERLILPARIRITLVLDMGEDRPELRLVTQTAPKIRSPIDVSKAIN